MKQWITASFQSNNSILRIGLFYGAILWIILEIPMLFISYNHFIESEEKKVALERKIAQKILSDAFLRESRFGDFVNARGVVKKMGAVLGLEDLAICKNNQDIIPKIESSRCKNNTNPVHYENIHTTKGQLKLEFLWSKVSLKIGPILIRTLLITALLALIIIFTITIFISKVIANRIRKLQEQIISYKELDDLSKLNMPLKDLVPITKSLKYLATNLKELQKKNLDLRVNVEVLKIAKQVSHDVRSPLTALSVAVTHCNGLEEEERITIRTQINRITDIANHLLLKNKDNQSFKNENKKTVLISTVLEESVTEKRLEYRSNFGISIEGQFDNSYGVFAKINPTNLKTIISNTVNNSVEAFQDGQGKITIKLLEDNDLLKVQVIDNGQGMSSEVLAKIGEYEFSHGKSNSTKSGSGIGVSSAIKVVREEWGGEMNYSSIPGKQTVMTITLPKQDPPSWFMPHIEINENTVVVCLDDDEGIHGIWKKRIPIAERLISLSTPEQIKQWVSNEAFKFQSILYLSDYELLGYDETGLDLIELLNLKNAVLVTSHYAEIDIMNRCSNLGVRLIPKMLAGSVPIRINQSNKSFERYNIVHLDDDRYLRIPWKKAALKAGLNILSVANEIELMNEIKKVEKDARFYIDESLGEDNIPGHKIAKKVYEAGFQNIYLSTGYPASYFTDIDFLKGVIGKTPPF